MASQRTLDSDQLGKKGEQRFGELCVSAGLIPNQATWDRKGWDFAIDWRHDVNEVDYDQRPTLRSCLVQVKSLWDGGIAVKAPLLALEHLAKDLKPAFIYALPVIDDEQYAAKAFVAHVRGDLLAHILKALREIRAKGDARLSEEKIRLPLKRWFAPIEQTGKSLRERLENEIGNSMEIYASEKQKEIRELGFEPLHTSVNMNIQAVSRDEFLDGFMGLKPLQFKDATATETRFGITLPIPNLFPQEGEFLVQPKPFSKCTIIIRDNSLDSPIVFKGEMFGPPSKLLAPGELRTLIKTKIFDLRFSAQGIVPPARVNLDMKITLNGERIRKLRLSVGEWTAFYNFLAISTKHPVNIEMLPGKGEGGPITGTISMDLTDTAAEKWPYGAAVCNGAERLLRMAGWLGTKLKIEEIGNAAEEIEVAEALIDEPDSLNPLSFETQIDQIISAGKSYDVLYVDGFELGDHSLVYAVKATMNPEIDSETIKWTSSQLSFIKLERVKSKKRDFEQFLERVKRETGLPVAAHGRFIPN